MTAKELIANLRISGSVELQEYFLYMAAHAHEARLPNGERIIDLLDFTTWLLELGKACKPETPLFLDPTCPDCGHVHLEDRECGVLTGPKRVCRCERAVPA